MLACDKWPCACAAAARELRSHPQPTLSILKAGCQRLLELAAPPAAGSSSDAAGLADAVEWLLERLDEAVGAASDSGPGRDSGLVCLALRALAGAVGPAMGSIGVHCALLDLGSLHVLHQSTRRRTVCVCDVRCGFIFSGTCGGDLFHRARFTDGAPDLYFQVGHKTAVDGRSDPAMSGYTHFAALLSLHACRRECQ